MQVKLLQVSMLHSYIWFRQGIWIFCRNPAMILMLVFLYLLILQMALFSPILGVLFILVASPTVSWIFMAVCQAISNNKTMSLFSFCNILKQLNKTALKRLLGLGIIYAIAILLISLVLNGIIDLRWILVEAVSPQQIPADIVNKIYTAFLFGGLLYLPVAMFMWFAPVIIVWRDIPIAKALLFSLIACWKNRYTFIFYLGFWLVIFIFVPLMIESLFDLVNAKHFSRIIIVPYSITMLALLYSSFYATWRACFIHS